VRILGIDPGTQVCGYAVLESDGHEARVLECGTVAGGRGHGVPERLKVIYNGLRSVIERLQPDVVAVEGAFFGKNVRSALKIGEARGVALLAAATGGLDVVEYAPAAVKRAVVGHGRAHKSQVQQMVKVICHLPDDPMPEDATDALAIALCHHHRAGTNLS